MLGLRGAEGLSVEEEGGMKMEVPQWGAGYVTFVASGGLVLLGLYTIFKEGGNLTNGMTLITAGLGLFGLRRAVDNAEKGK